MPILTVHLQHEACSGEQLNEFMKQASELYAAALECPLARVRVFMNLYAPDRVAVAGRITSESGARAAYFEFLALQGRPLEQRHRLLEGFTDLLQDILGVERSVIRGVCHNIAPEDWAIAGTPASVARQKEIAARALED